MTRLGAWVRDLQADGDVESNPGPRYVTKNINSIQGPGKLYHTLKAIRQEANRKPLTAVFLQDHHLLITRQKDIESIAKGQLLLPITAYAHKAANGQGYGGTMILIPYEALEETSGNSIHAKCDTVRATRRASMQGRLISANLKVSGTTRQLVAAYAPASTRPNDPIPNRTTFFKKLDKLITRHAIIGMDANCVHDTKIDLARDAPSAYNNEGAEELAKLVDSKGLQDVTRTLLGPTQPLYTAHHIVSGHRTCKSRIDHIYVPSDGVTQWSEVACNDFFPPRPDNVEIDHLALEVTANRVTLKRGTDIAYVNEKIFEIPTVNRRIHECIVEDLQHHLDLDLFNSDPNHWRAYWETLKQKLRDICVKESAKLKYVEGTDLRLKRKQLKAVDKRVQSGRSYSDDATTRAKLQSEITKLRAEEYTLHQTLEREAYNMGKAHDRCTAEMFRPWKPTHQAQHIEALAQADWSDPSNPVFTGGEAKGHSAVLEELTKYYESLFARKIIDEQAVLKCLETLNDPNSRRVLPPTADMCGAPITPEEVLPTLENLPTGKSSGPDRLPNKLYKVHSQKLAVILTHVYNESHREGALPATCIEGTISVLYKKKSRNDPRNYRPITLLNNDYKILTRVYSPKE